MRFFTFIVIMLSALILTACDLAGSLAESTQGVRDELRAAAHGTPIIKPIKPDEAREILERLPVTKPLPLSGFSDRQYPRWTDPDRNGCDARQDALIAWSNDVRTDPGCSIRRGIWIDPYTGNKYSNHRQLVIDHTVTLADAHRKGAGEWTQEKRTKFANDPANLIPVHPTTHDSKKRDGTRWKPPRHDFWCEYSLRVLQVHDLYSLPLFAKEKQLLRSMLDTCS